LVQLQQQLQLQHQMKSLLHRRQQLEHPPHLSQHESELALTGPHLESGTVQTIGSDQFESTVDEFFEPSYTGVNQTGLHGINSSSSSNDWAAPALHSVVNSAAYQNSWSAVQDLLEELVPMGTSAGSMGASMTG